MRARAVKSEKPGSRWWAGAVRVAFWSFEQTQLTHERFVERRAGDFLLRPSPARSFSSASTLAGTDAEHVQRHDKKRAKVQ